MSKVFSSLPPSLSPSLSPSLPPSPLSLPSLSPLLQVEQEKAQKEKDCASLEAELEKINDTLARTNKEKKGFEERLAVRWMMYDVTVMPWHLTISTNV